MTRYLALSGVALAALMAASPVQAQLLNLGGSGDSDSTVSVDLGGTGGTGGGLLGLGGTGGTTGTVGINDDTIIDINGDGVGDLIDLDGDGVGDQEIDVDLFGPGDDGETQLAVGTGGATDEDVLVTLFGSGSGARTANVNVLPGGTGGLGGAGGDGTDADVTLDLFGPAAGGGGGAGGTDPTQTGSTGDTGGGDGTGVFGPDDGVQPLPSRPGGATRVAAAGNAAATADNCFEPNEEQIAYLLSRGTYSATVTAGWNSASEVSLVPINLCPDARARLDAALDADANIANMQSAVAMNSTIRSELDPNFTADDVLAVDQSGNELTVYVY